MITLGLAPQDLTVVLSRDTSFVTALVAPEPWPAGTVIELRFTLPDDTSPTVWAATILGARADWNRPDTQVAVVLDAGKTKARLVAVDAAGRELLWARGWVRVT